MSKRANLLLPLLMGCWSCCLSWQMTGGTLWGEEPLSASRKLLEAARSGDRRQVEELLQSSMPVPVDEPDEYGLTPWQWARTRGDTEVAERLVAAGADAQKAWPTTAELVNRLLQHVTSREVLGGDSPAVALLAARDGEVVARAAAGFASLEHRVPATVETKFRIGSVTKQFTAAAILKLQEQGKLSVQDTIDQQKYFPGYPRGGEVTIHHLLTHTSGIASYTSQPNFSETAAAPIEADRLIESFRDLPYDFDPGKGWSYSNSGYFLLGRMVEKVSGESYDQFLRRQFFEPLEMRDTGVYRQNEIYAHDASGYSWDAATKRYGKAAAWDMEARAGAAGALYSTIDDLYRWNEGLFGGRVLSAETLQAAWTPVEVAESKEAMRYGYGWSIADERGLKVIAHGGGLPGFVSYLMRFPDQKVTVVALVAAAPGAPGFSANDLASRVAEWMLWQEMQPVSPEKSVAVSEALLAEYVGEYDYRTAIMKVRREGTRLFAQLSGQPEYEIFPASEQEFYWKVVQARATFVKNDAGQVTHLVHDQNGRKFNASRLAKREAVTLDPAALDAYVGRYDYGARLLVMKVTKEDGRLYAQLTGQPKLELVPKGDDGFFWRDVPAEIQFVRDEGGAVVKGVHTQAGQTFDVPRIP